MSDNDLICQLLAIIDAQATLMAAYRVGSTRTPEKALDVLSRATDVIDEARQRAGVEKPSRR